MARAIIFIEFLGGTMIQDAFDEAKRIAEKLDVCVKFNFNGVTCATFPGGNSEIGKNHYFKELKGDSKYKYAINR